LEVAEKLFEVALIDATVDGKIACTVALVDALGIQKAWFSSEVTDTSFPVSAFDVVV